MRDLESRSSSLVAYVEGATGQSEQGDVAAVGHRDDGNDDDMPAGTTRAPHDAYMGVR